MRRSRRCPLNRGFIVLNWKIFGYFSLHFHWVIHGPVKIAIGNGSEKSYMYFLTPSFCSFKRRISRSPPISVARVRILASTLSLLLVFSLAPTGFSPGTSVLPSPLKPTLSNSNSIWNARTCFNKFLTTPRCSVGKQITPKKIAPVVETLDSAIHRINPYPRETIVRKQEISTADQKDQPNCVIHWIEIYPVDNDWTTAAWFLQACAYVIVTLYGFTFFWKKP